MLNTKFMNDDAQEVDDTVLIIEQALARSGLTKAQLCRELGISPSRYNNWRKRGVPLEFAQPLSSLLKIPLDTFLLRSPPAVVRSAHPDPLPSNLSSGPDLQQVPLISWVHAGDASEAIDNYPPGWAEEWVEAPRNIHSRAYALRIVGNSMAPEFLPGTVIIVEPEVDWRSGSYVIDCCTLFVYYSPHAPQQRAPDPPNDTQGGTRQVGD